MDHYNNIFNNVDVIFLGLAISAFVNSEAFAVELAISLFFPVLFSGGKLALCNVYTMYACNAYMYYAMIIIFNIMVL